MGGLPRAPLLFPPAGLVPAQMRQPAVTRPLTGYVVSPQVWHSS